MSRYARIVLGTIILAGFGVIMLLYLLAVYWEVTR
jgi:hypothetical protein